MGGFGAVILVWGGRCSTVFFLLSGGSQLIYPFPPGYSQGLAATFFIMVAMVFLVMTEGIAVYLIWVYVLRTSNDPAAPERLSDLLRRAFAVFGSAADTIRSIRRATLDPTDNDNKPKQPDKDNKPKQPDKRGRSDKAANRTKRDPQ